MAEIVSYQLQLDCTPQPSPRAAVHFVYESMTQLRKKGLYQLTHSAHQPFLCPDSLARQHKQVGLPAKSFATLFSAIGLICYNYRAVCGRRRPHCCIAVSSVDSSQNGANDPAFYVQQHVQLKSEEPTDACLGEESSGIRQQPHYWVTNRLADSYGLGDDHIKREVEAVGWGRWLYHLTERIRQYKQRGKLLLVRAELWESRSEVQLDEAIGLLERSEAQRRLHQRDSQNLRISQSRLGVRR